ncbi:ImmA/IrrE family metallo-endopeptidase [Staphylococcus saprophyticus]|uniref:ImmA/IrrE family metallo-endopeptidase n=1 Tax=Staphylococcus saprophyticus TaxID=29385 RepID=UPI000853CE8F|nr:ImmA/IrrE family metallo-endopeptidase [Staphylococcus saprophyticus]MDW4048358.1 ImmA/IrrE family metallo-endopeptidase [Staphylococcus saprophyticus]MDW4288173.1 ImmA/IrrE family metallo-endopeptidase [Staphylococcus saprophyticus]MDW4446050.1 ImmA/IrrE family metallo-endopeptidase [Staphylococcus saprophyticus]OEK40799.1 toxin [Staphylococcus saprophyticus]
MSRYENILIDNDNLDITETCHLPTKLSGVTFDNMIFIRSDMDRTHKLETLAEEIAHLHVTYGDIRDQSKLVNRKYELKARRYAYERLITLQGIIDAFHAGICNLHEMASYFEVSKSYVLDTIKHYKMKYGLDVYYKGYVIKFEPLQVFEHHKWD